MSGSQPPDDANNDLEPVDRPTGSESAIDRPRYQPRHIDAARRSRSQRQQWAQPASSSTPTGEQGTRAHADGASPTCVDGRQRQRAEQLLTTLELRPAASDSSTSIRRSRSTLRAQQGHAHTRIFRALGPGQPARWPRPCIPMQRESFHRLSPCPELHLRASTPGVRDGVDHSEALPALEPSGPAGRAAHDLQSRR